MVAVPEYAHLNTEINAAGKLLAQIDVSFANKIIDRLNSSETEVDVFSKNPKEYVNRMGFQTPDGAELYFIDKNRTAHPHQHDKPSASTGSRVVAEIYKDGGILGWCVICFGCINI